MIKDENECVDLEKCQLCNEESVSKNLCIKCNNKKEYYFLNYAIENPNYIDCVNNITKPKNFYFNEENKNYEPCFYTCATCVYGGDGIENNCTSCELNYIIKPDFPNSTNCVIKCLYFYYYTVFDQYKCTPSEECPKDYNLMIKQKKNVLTIVKMIIYISINIMENAWKNVQIIHIMMKMNINVKILI